MTGSGGAIDFFALEAGEYVERIDALLAASGRDRAPDADPLARTARALRGAATMARHTALADLAAAIEGVAAQLRDAPGAWTPATHDALVAAVDAYKSLLRVARQWTPDADALAAGRAAELRALATAGAPNASRAAVVVPISRLFADGDAQPIVHRNPQPAITADLRFRQAAVPLASTLRRLIGEARQATDDGARRGIAEDLRAALRDLGELAESYDIRPVANFARAREDALGRLDDRALDVVDGAAQALVESAGSTWARKTPPSTFAAVAAPTTAQPTPQESATAAARREAATEATTAATPDAAPDESPDDAPNEPVDAAPDAVPNATLGATSDTTLTAAPSEPVRTAPSATPPTGQALVALLETSISGLHMLGAESSVGLREPEGTRDERPATAATPGDDVVPIDALVYRGRAALDRAREIAAHLRPAPVPDPALLAELYDLLDLAAAEEPATA